MKRLLMGLIFGLLVSFSVAEVRLPSLFTDGMILQRETEVPVWGWAEPGEQVTVEGSWGAKAAGTADADGLWMVRLKTGAAGGGSHQLTIRGENTLVVKGVLLGEVWLCSGQSNIMQNFEGLLRSTKDMDFPGVAETTAQVRKDMEMLADENFRVFTVERNPVFGDSKERCEGEWKSVSPEHNTELAVVPVYFGRRLRSALGVPVGVIVSGWGGTAIQPWLPLSRVKANPFTLQKLEKADFNSKKKWHLPSALYNGMVRPLMPYAIRGAIWYQGESSSHGGQQPQEYERMLKDLVEEWRLQWGQGDFPFYMVQLAGYGKEKAGWSLIREANVSLYHSMPNMGVVVTTDVGQKADIHPKNKIDTGNRLALWALANEYGKSVAYSGPLYASYSVKQGKVLISFTHTDAGLMVGKKIGIAPVEAVQMPLKMFEVCGANRKWVEAEATIVGDQVLVWSDTVADPVTVRYAWRSETSAANLYNGAGLPASPFRTDRVD